MKYYIIAGEASGDLHGSNLIIQLKKQDANASFRCWGGDLMQNAGGNLVKHYKELAFMGFIEVVKNLPAILRNLAFCKQDIQAFNPDILILVDYPGFNLRIAEWAKKNLSLKIVYYISPQVWAWKSGRVKKMKECIDKMLVILPFEKAYFQHTWHWDVQYVGHPLIEVIDRYKKENPIPKSISNKPIIALLPGSRKQEIAAKLPIMLAVSKHFPNYQFIVAQAPGMEASFYEQFTQPYPNVSASQNKTYDLLMQSSAALVTSGTATLETALFKVPQIVCYKTSNISYAIGKRLVKIKFISLVNLIMDQLVVKEFIQDALNNQNLVEELRHLLTNENYQQKMQENYQQLWEILSKGGAASQQAAKAIVSLV
ncbi:MAG: lipid-A-disaccharide synthase [Chitinophagaceae bacterium]